MPRRPPNRVRFPLDYRHRIYQCASCRNHILNVPRHNGHISSYNPNFAARRSLMTPDGEMTSGVVCNPGALVNVVFDNIRNRTFRHRMNALGVFCDVCGVRLGDQVVVRHSVYRRPGVVIAVRSGPLLLDPDCLVYWDGRMSIWADNNEPADELDDD